MATSARSSNGTAPIAPVRPAPAVELERLRRHPGEPREPFRIIIAGSARRPLRTIAIPARLPAITLSVLGALVLAAAGLAFASYTLRGSVHGLRSRLSAMSAAADELARHPLAVAALPPLAAVLPFEGTPRTHAIPEHQVPPERLGRFTLESVNNGESMEVTLDLSTGEPDEASYLALRHLMRCLHSGAETPIDPRLISLLHAIAQRTGQKILLVSGYRLRMYSTVSFTYHARGMAADIRIPGMTALMVRDLAVSMGVKGVGYYPNSLFVHVDVRDQKSYWTDYGTPRGDDDNHGGD